MASLFRPESAHQLLIKFPVQVLLPHKPVPSEVGVFLPFQVYVFSSRPCSSLKYVLEVEC